MRETQVVTIQTRVHVSREEAWRCWTQPEHIMKWNAASEDWHTTRAENDLRAGGSFSSRMEARDGSTGFDFGGKYDEVREPEFIAYTLGDGRKVSITFTADSQETLITEIFETEAENSAEMQRIGWQAILDHFKRYVEAIR